MSSLPDLGPPSVQLAVLPQKRVWCSSSNFRGACQILPSPSHSCSPKLPYTTFTSKRPPLRLWIPPPSSSLCLLLVCHFLSIPTPLRILLPCFGISFAWPRHARTNLYNPGDCPQIPSPSINHYHTKPSSSSARTSFNYHISIVILHGPVIIVDLPRAFPRFNLGSVDDCGTRSSQSVSVCQEKLNTSASHAFSHTALPWLATHSNLQYSSWNLRHPALYVWPRELCVSLATSSMTTDPPSTSLVSCF